MEFKQAFVSLKNPEKIFSIIEDTLSSQPDTQVFVDEKLYKQICAKLYSPNILDSTYHYFEGQVEWFELHDRKNKILYHASFVSNTEEYVQLVEFNSPKVSEYIHYLSGFKQLLLILVKPKE